MTSIATAIVSPPAHDSLTLRFSRSLRNENTGAFSNQQLENITQRAATHPEPALTGNSSQPYPQPTASNVLAAMTTAVIAASQSVRGLDHARELANRNLGRAPTKPTGRGDP